MSFIFVGLVPLLYGIALASPSLPLKNAARNRRILIIAGFTFHSGGIFLRGMDSLLAGSGPWAVVTLYETLVILSWFLPVFAFLLSPKECRSSILKIALAAATLIMIFVSLCPWLPRDIRTLSAAFLTWRLPFHALTALSAYGAFAVAAVAAILCLRRREEDPLRNSFFRTLTNGIAVGRVLLAIGIISGAAWAYDAWGSYWSWDPKQNGALATWLFFTVISHLEEGSGERQQRRVALLTLLGLASIIITYLVADAASELHRFLRQ
ncbi:MAG: cytochrome c biogenesis protein CcsA [Deltaproteobacteria bacterium]|nr:cytochrome c biogenesis protein CcsA [Deltaproteobacteria bacterium]